MHDELVQLMVRFALCFPMADSKKFVAPQLLSPAEPEYDWDDADNLVLRYEYDVMPKGIVRRLIVALHDLIEGARVWRSGVVLTQNQSRAEIIEEYHRRRLRIRLLGADPTGATRHDRSRAIDDSSFLSRDQLRHNTTMVLGGICLCHDPTMFTIKYVENFARAGDADPVPSQPASLLNQIPLSKELWSDPTIVANF